MSNCCCNEAEQYICVPCKWKGKQMNDKDKEAFEKWLEAQNWHYDSFDNEYYQNGLKISIYSETEEAWQDACEYKDKSLINGTRMKQMNERIEELLIENAKLRELVKDLARNGMDYDIASRIEELDELSGLTRELEKKYPKGSA